jgi:thermostable 8-oxoguanine DNA glycosylase
MYQNTPSSKKLYLTIEDIVINLAKESGKTMAEFDLDIWNRYKVA